MLATSSLHAAAYANDASTVRRVAAEAPLMCLWPDSRGNTPLLAAMGAHVGFPGFGPIEGTLPNDARETVVALLAACPAACRVPFSGSVMMPVDIAISLSWPTWMIAALAAADPEATCAPALCSRGWKNAPLVAAILANKVDEANTIVSTVPLAVVRPTPIIAEDGGVVHYTPLVLACALGRVEIAAHILKTCGVPCTPPV